MKLITLNFTLQKQRQSNFVKALNNLKEIFHGHGYTISLFRDVSNNSRFILVVLTDKSMDDFTLLIKNDSNIRELFSKIKESDGRVVVSVSEQIV